MATRLCALLPAAMRSVRRAGAALVDGTIWLTWYQGNRDHVCVDGVQQLADLTLSRQE